MKRVIFLISVICFLAACDKMDRDRGPAPAPLKECEVEPIHGGAVISYNIPKDGNVMYVMAEYERNGKIYTERSSIHYNWLTIEGFHTTDSVHVNLYTVSKKEVRSESALSRSFVPLESPLSLAFKSLRMITGFGGIIAYWDNQTKTELGVRLMTDSIDRHSRKHWVEKKMYFSRIHPEKHSFRGFDTITYNFAICMTDKWGNISDTMVYTCKPYFERMTPKPFSRNVFNPSNASPPPAPIVAFDQNTQSNNTNLSFTCLSDNVTRDPGGSGANSWRTESRTDRQASFTLDFESSYKLSRMIMWPRMRWDITTPWEDVYKVNNVLSFEIWGTDEPFADWPLDDKGYWLCDFSFKDPQFNSGGVQVSSPSFKDHWQYFGELFEVPRYDLMGYSGDDIVNLRNAGWEFDFDLELKPVRYIRFFVRSTNQGSPTPGAFFQITELSFFGDNTFKK